MARKRESIQYSPKRIKRVLKERGISIAAFARQIGYTREYLASVLSRRTINPNMLNAIAKGLSLSPDYLRGLIKWTIQPESLEKMHQHCEFPMIDPDGFVMETYEEYLKRTEFNEYQSDDVVGQYLRYRVRTSNYVFSDGSSVTEEYVMRGKGYVDSVIHQYLKQFFENQDSDKPLIDYWVPPIE